MVYIGRYYGGDYGSDYSGNLGATSGTTSEATSEATPGDVRRGDKRITINSKHQLQKITADHLDAPLDPLIVDW